MKVLIVVDMQNDFIDGALGTKEAIRIVPSVARKINTYRECGYPVVFTRDTHDENYMNTQEGKKLPVPHCIKDTKGWEIAYELNVAESTVIDKETFGSFELVDEIMKLVNEGNIKEVELVGLCTDICVIANAMLIKTAFPEVYVSVDSSCCAGVTPETHKIALAAMGMCQIGVEGAEQ